MKKALFYNPYMSTLGGGERHFLQIAQCLSELGISVDLAMDESLGRAIEGRLGIDLKFARVVPSLRTMGFVAKLRMTYKYDYFIYVSDGSYVLSLASKTFIFAMVPQKSLFERKVIDSIKLLNTKYIANSNFTCDAIAGYGVRSQVLYPYIVKDKIGAERRSRAHGTNIKFLSVGRFFEGLHSKRQDVCIAWFLRFIQDPQFAGSTLTLVGGCDPMDHAYLDRVREIAKYAGNIRVLENAPATELEAAYASADCYLHFAGWGVDEALYPEKVEHLGITPLESMARGVPVFAYLIGGIKETVTDGYNGYTFLDFDELDRKVKGYFKSSPGNTVVGNAVAFINDKFTKECMKGKLRDIIQL